MDNHARNASSVNNFVTIPELSLTTGFVLTVFVVVLTLLFIFLPTQYRDALLFFAAACAAAGQLAAAFYAAKVLQFTVNSQNAENNIGAASRTEGNQRYFNDKAEDFAKRWNDATLFHVRQHCEEIIQKRSDQKAIKEKLDADPVFGANVRHVLNFLEELALCVNGKRCDEAVAKSLFCGIVVNVWHATDFFVKEQRTARSRPQIWAELEGLYGRWK